MRGPLSLMPVHFHETLLALGAQNATNQRPFFAWHRVADFKAVGDEALRFGQLCAAIVMNCDQGFAFFYAVADALVKFEADGVVDGVFFFLAATPKSGQSGAELFTIGRHDEARQRT